MTRDATILALAKQAKADQLASMARARTALDAYWAASASASVGHHYARKAYRTVNV